MKSRLPSGILTPVASGQHRVYPTFSYFLRPPNLPVQLLHRINQQRAQSGARGGQETRSKKEKRTRPPTRWGGGGRVTFGDQGSEALRAHNQYHIFHRHLHRYCKWLVSKIITGCIRNPGFAISPLSLGGPRLLLPLCSFTPAPPGVNDARVADTSHTSADFLRPPNHSLSPYP